MNELRWDLGPADEPLEDGPADIVGKAARGLGLGLAEVAARCGRPAAEVDRVLEWEIEPRDARDAALVRAVAPVLGLGAERLLAVARGEHQPAPVVVEGLQRLRFLDEDMWVNVIVAWDPATRAAVVCDCGPVGAGEVIARWLAERGLRLESILLTHEHSDHVEGLPGLVRATGAVARIARRAGWSGAEPFDDGAVFTVGGLRLATRRTSGHAAGGTTFLVEGLARPVAVVGDAIFAGSIGGARSVAAFAEARQHVMALLDGLAAETVLAPGHGPLTTVAEERAANPFLG